MESLLQLLESLLSSPWLYVLIVAVVAADVLAPVIPGETMVITAGAFAVAGGPVDPVLLVVSAAAGALIGDIAAHHVGRGAGPLARLLRRLKVADALFRWAETGLADRGGAVIVAARFLPGGRTAVAVTSGIVRYPRPRFIAYTAMAGAAWAVYSAGIGMVGGTAFHEQPLIGVAIGIGLAVVVGGTAELIRSRRSRREPAPRARRTMVRAHAPRHLRRGLTVPAPQEARP